MSNEDTSNKRYQEKIFRYEQIARERAIAHLAWEELSKLVQCSSTGYPEGKAKYWASVREVLKHCLKLFDGEGCV